MLPAEDSPPPLTMPPSTLLIQSWFSKLNDFFHRDYVTDVVFYCFWLGFWLLMPTIIFLGTLALAVYDLVTVKGYRQPCGPVLITGCDMGFGKDLALALAGKGWKVIAACSTDAGLSVYRTAANNSCSSSSSTNITPVKVNMSSETDIQALAEKLAYQHPEGLYALVNNNNNTVVGKDGAIEWMSIQNYEMHMEVNLYSFIRATKAYLPLLKKHVRHDPKHKARIITLNSNAGIVPGQPNASCYAAAKHACDGWMSSLTFEAKVWGIDVASVCPCWHEIEIEYFPYDLFATLPLSVQEDYGREYYTALTEGAKAARAPIMWKSENVTRALVHAVTAEKQRPYVVVGMDGRFVTTPLLFLPRRIYNAIFAFITGISRLKPKAVLLRAQGTSTAGIAAAAAVAGARAAAGGGMGGKASSSSDV